MKKLVLLPVGIIMMSGISYSQTYTTLYNFTGAYPQGSSPGTPPVISGDWLYGETNPGGNIDTNNNGCIWKIKLDGTNFTILHAFARSDTNARNGNAGISIIGNEIFGVSVLGSSKTPIFYKLNTDGTGFTLITPSNDNLGSVINGGISYGSNGAGGTYNGGYIYQIDSNGTNYSIIYSFGADTTKPSNPEKIFDGGNQLYGFAKRIGTQSKTSIYKINKDGTNIQYLHTFNGGSMDGL